MNLEPAQWERRLALFQKALELPESERALFLESECEDEPDVHADVLALLEEDQEGHPFLDGELSKIAHHLLDGWEPLHGAIGAYTLKRVLGRGGTGVVYLAERENLEHVVAIKVLRDGSVSPARRERFEREKKTLARLSHSSVPRLFDADVLADGTSYIIMEYVDGVPITTYCDERNSSIRERLRLFRAVCEAVQYAHGRAILHLDLKPTNILVADGGKVKLLDFGISRVVDGLDASSSDPQSEFRQLTPAYAAPEQLRGEEVGVYTDVFSLGIILYELLAGVHPFEGSKTQRSDLRWDEREYSSERPSRVRSRRAGRPASRRNSTIGRQNWADLDAMCLKAMHEDPKQRYETVESLLRDLEHFARSEPLQARQAAIGYRLNRFLVRNRRPVTVLLAAVAAALALITFYTIQVTEERNRARIAAANSEQVSEYLIQLFEAGDPYIANGDSVSVRQLLERGVERVEDLSLQPRVQAQMFDVLGRVHTGLSLFDQAELLLERALSLRRELEAPLEIAESLVNIGDMYSYRGEYDKAESSLREALSIRQRHLPPNDALLARTFDKLGVVLNRKGEYEQAETLYRLALRIQREIYSRPDRSLGTTLNNLAVNQFDQGNYDAAELYYREALAVERPLLGDEHPSIAIGLANLGVLLETRGNFAAADSALTEALHIKRETLGNDHYETAFSLTQLGGMLRRKGDHERAETYLREALAIEERVLGPDHRNTAATLNHLGLSLQDRGDYEAAEPLLRRATRIFGERLGESHPFTGITLCHIAHLQHLRGHLQEAESDFDECLSILEASLPPGHDVLAMNRGKYGSLLTALHRFDEAEPILIDSYDKLQAHFGGGHPDTQRAQNRLVNLYDASDRPHLASNYREQKTDGMVVE